MSTVQLKTKIYEILSAICTTYSELAEQNASFLYAVYHIESIPLDSREDYLLIIDIWDNDPDTAELENTLDSVYTAFNYQSYTNSNVAFHAYCLWRGSVPDEDESIHRRQARFQLKTYYK